MVTDAQVRRLMKRVQTEKTLAVAAAKAGMDEKTARKYRDAGRLPSQLAAEPTWRTRIDPFEEVWPGLKDLLDHNPGLEAKQLFEYLQREHPGAFPDGQLRTLQRRVKVWRALEGPAKETYFPQIHKPGQLCQSDFTDLSSLGVTIQGRPFAHLLYHFVLTYSNWETERICFSESFEALRRPARRLVGAGGRAQGPPDRLSECRRAQARPPRRVHAAIRRPAVSLRPGGPQDQPGQPARKRGRGAGASSLRPCPSSRV